MNGIQRSGAPRAVALEAGLASPRSGRVGRFVRRKLVVPFLRRDRSPEYSSRSVAVGLLIGLTPTLGIHLPLVVVVWAVVGKFFPRKKFGLVVALAWTCLMNPLTAPPLYYLFLVTGRAILGGTEFVLPMLIGCVPWAILSAFIGYRWSLWFNQARRLRRARRARAGVLTEIAATRTL